METTSCNSCPRKCGINRNEAVGFCGVGNKVMLSRVGLHFWEEPIISGTKGSGTVFFSGCNLKCCYCQNMKISHESFGKEVTIKRLSEVFYELEQSGAHNINLVTPTHYVKQIKEAVSIYKPKIPIVYNTSGYESVETIKDLKNVVDVYLTDLKYVSEKLSQDYSGAKDYFEKASKAILEMKKNQSEDVIENGIMKKGIIVRLLVLPNCTDDAVKILQWVHDNLGKQTYVSIMSQYVPMGEINKFPELNRKISKLEYKRICEKAKSLGFENGFLQSFESASNEYIPNFDLSGV